MIINDEKYSISGDTMNQVAFENIITFYKNNYKKIEAEELYKWRAVQIFQDNWDIEAEDFYDMLKRSLSGTANLMSSGYYYPRRMILWMAEKDSNAVREMFRDLYDLSGDFRERVYAFRDSAKSLLEKYKVENANNHYQDDRAIMAYLNLRYPEKYYLYKYTMFRDFVEYIDYDEIPVNGKFENLLKFDSLCNYIKNVIMKDDELLRLYEPRREKFYDPEYHLLVQDIIYTIYYKMDPSLLDTEKENHVALVAPKEFQKEVIKAPIELKGVFVDYAERERKLKLEGDMGEQFIFQQEREKVKRYRLPKSKVVKWVSRDQGDGLGYDILSYDAKGDPMYIEVKTTTGPEETSFYISANELEMSKLYADNYYLYRVYEFDTRALTGQYSVRKGALDQLCIVPQTYKVDLK